MLRIYAYLDAWRTRIANSVGREEGIEAVEWIALAAVLLTLLAGILVVFRAQAASVAEAMIGQIMTWIVRWGG
jgi:hypothetical protein